MAEIVPVASSPPINNDGVVEMARNLPRNVTSRSTSSSHFGSVLEDEDELTLWSIIEKLPSYARTRSSVLKEFDENGKVLNRRLVDVAELTPHEHRMIADRLVKDVENDNGKVLQSIRDRMARVGIELPKVEVRYKDLNVEANVRIGTRALPTLWNVARNIIEDLLDTVHLSPSKKTKFNILKDVSGIIKPSRLTLLLGPPGCGKSTLLQTLAGRPDRELKMNGDIFYNGFRFDEFVPQKTATYISQTNLHIGEMTVRETIDFAVRCLGIGTREELVLEIAQREKRAGIFPDADIDTYMKAFALKGMKRHMGTDYIMKILGLDICSEVIAGDEMRKGISGGQKKRLTTGELLLSPVITFFMDETSTGLDSSTTYTIVKSIQQLAHTMQATILMSLLQPAPETFVLFDDIILLADGHIVYHGPRENILEFFKACGFQCPERKDTPDFMQEVISKKDQEQYWSNENKNYRYISPYQFSQKFREFHIGKKMLEELSNPLCKSSGDEASLSFKKFSLTKWEIFKTCFAREWLLMKRNSFVYIFQMVQVILVSIITVTVFLRTRMKINLEHGNYYLGALFFSLTIMMFNGFTELAFTLFRLPIFFKQRDLYFYPAWAFTIPGFILKIPVSFLESLIWVTITYYGTGYAPEAERFFRQFFAFFSMHLMATSLFRAIAGLSRSMVVASAGGSVAIFFVLVLGGFLIPRTSIARWWRWAFWISPLSYAETAITVNEFLSPRWTIENNDIGTQILQSRDLFHEPYLYWVGVGGLIGFVIFFNIVYTLALSYLNALKYSQVIIPVGKQNKIQDDREGKGSSKSHNAEDLCKSEEFTSALSSFKSGMILPFKPVAISFRNIQYFVDMPTEIKAQGTKEKRLQLLRDVTGAFRPGILTALMGASGAGKTTLMDVLAGRKTRGQIEGEVYISGFPKVEHTFSRVLGYCEQNDIHSPQVTVYESLIYSAWLRLECEIDKESREHFVDEVMKLVELDDLRHAVVGIPGVSGLSTEQRKRLTIAVELVANPSVIFMDEPTTGLDARAAKIVMRAVRNTVDTGRTVVCTIHQPSTDVFESFDELLLMKLGGEIIYAGPLGYGSQKVIEYFEAIPGVQNVKNNQNPATWMLDITSSDNEHRLGINFAPIYKDSIQFQKTKELVEEVSTPAAETVDLAFSTLFAQSAWEQFKACLWKQYWTYWRSPGYNLVRAAFTFLGAILFGTIYWQRGRKIYDEQDLFTMLGAIYGATMIIGINNSSNAQPHVDVERTVYYREKAAGMFSPVVYALAQVSIEIPYVLLQTCMYGIITYSTMGYYWSASKFFWYLYIMFCTFLYFTYFGMLTVAITPNFGVASILSSFFYTIFNLFSGFIIPKSQIPGWWIWYYWICPVAWTLNGLITSQYGDMNKEIKVLGSPDKPIRKFLEDYFGFHHDFLGVVAVVLAIFPVFFAVTFAYAISKLNFQKR